MLSGIVHDLHLFFSMRVCCIRPLLQCKNNKSRKVYLSFLQILHQRPQTSPSSYPPHASLSLSKAKPMHQLATLKTIQQSQCWYLGTPNDGATSSQATNPRPGPKFSHTLSINLHPCHASLKSIASLHSASDPSHTPPPALVGIGQNVISTTPHTQLPATAARLHWKPRGPHSHSPTNSYSKILIPTQTILTDLPPRPQACSHPHTCSAPHLHRPTPPVFTPPLHSLYTISSRLCSCRIPAVIRGSASSAGSCCSMPRLSARRPNENRCSPASRTTYTVTMLSRGGRRSCKEMHGVPTIVFRLSGLHGLQPIKAACHRRYVWCKQPDCRCNALAASGERWPGWDGSGAQHIPHGTKRGTSQYIMGAVGGWLAGAHVVGTVVACAAVLAG